MNAPECGARFADAAELRDFLASLALVHQLPGRVRLKLNGASRAALSRLTPSARLLEAALARMPGIVDVRVNPLAASVTIAYDATCIADAAWVDLLAGRDTPVACSLWRSLQSLWTEVSSL